MAISAKSLFHFTSKAEYLISIIENGFYPRYSFEERELESSLDMAIPMVCFCDLPLSGVTDHIGFYGNYGIGLKKEWAIKNGINPVLYLAKASQLSECLNVISMNLVGMFSSLEKSLKEGSITEEQINSFIKKYGKFVTEMCDFSKPIYGKMYRDGKTIDKYFYDEREWRYIPPIDTKDKNYRLSKEDFENSIKLAQSNTLLSRKHNLKFKINDIKYIIVSSENDIYAMIEAINEIYDKGSIKERQMLFSRILTVNQINEDF